MSLKPIPAQSRQQDPGGTAAASAGAPAAHAPDEKRNAYVDFGALPPEINSAHMYAGAGAAPLLAAAAAWNGTAAELSTAASSFESVITRLGTEHWVGPASLSMAAAAQPVVAWLTYTAESAAHAATQAIGSAGAFETAYAMTVPPAEVAANRAQLGALIANNILGQNVPAIAAVEARYGEMWAQDASAMYSYAASCAVAGRLDPLTKPSHITNAAGMANQAAAVGLAAASTSEQQVGLSNLITNAPNAVHRLASPATSTPAAAELNTLIHSIDGLLGTPLVHSALTHTVSGSVADHGVTAATGNPGDDDTVGAVSKTAPAVAAAAASHSATPADVDGTPLSTGLGAASSVGRLSVPASWSTAAPAMTAATAVDGSGWAVPAEDEPIAAMPGAPGVAVPEDDTGIGAGPRYGVKPIVMSYQHESSRG
jgi:PPE-repeat protein